MDPLADMFVSIVNGGRAHKEHVFIPYSKVKMEICRVLQSKGYVGESARRGKKNKRMIEIPLVYREDVPALEGARCVSKQSQRVYSGWRSMRKFALSKGILIISTPKGIMTARDAEKQKVGGEIIAKIW